MAAGFVEVGLPNLMPITELDLRPMQLGVLIKPRR